VLSTWRILNRIRIVVVLVLIYGMFPLIHVLCCKTEAATAPYATSLHLKEARPWL